VTSIGAGAFASCENLSEIVISSTVTSIGWNAFAWCDNLTSITLPSHFQSDISEFGLSDSCTKIYVDDSAEAE
jgi:hypothetical protein